MHPITQTPAFIERPQVVQQPSDFLKNVSARGIYKPDRKTRTLTPLQKFSALKRSCKALFNCPGVVEHNTSFSPMPDVGMCKKLIASANTYSHLGTSGVVGCLVYCCRGKTAQGEVILALAHSPGHPPRDVLESLMEDMKLKACIKDTVEIYVIGGIAPSDDDIDGSIEEEREVLLLAKKFPLRGVVFNVAELDRTTLDVVISSTGVYYSLSRIFEALPGLGEAGEQI